MKSKDVRVRLKRDHYADGRLRRAGNVVKLSPFAAEWLIEQGRAVRVDGKTR